MCLPIRKDMMLPLKVMSRAKGNQVRPRRKPVRRLRYVGDMLLVSLDETVRAAKIPGLVAASSIARRWGVCRISRVGASLLDSLPPSSGLIRCSRCVTAQDRSRSHNLVFWQILDASSSPNLISCLLK